MDRYWLLTWTTYGTWLPGDGRGFVGSIRDDENRALIHNVPGTPYDVRIRKLEQFAEHALACPPIRLNASQSRVVMNQLQETARIRGWTILAAAVMANHVHVVVGVSGDPDPATLLRDFKSYTSRALNRAFQKPKSGTWWTESGSKRKLADESAVLAAIQYVRQQERPLAILIPTN